MDYLSVKEMAELWGVSIRMVNYYLNTGRIQGAIRKSGGWLIPANTPHPTLRSISDGRSTSSTANVVVS